MFMLTKYVHARTHTYTCCLPLLLESAAETILMVQSCCAIHVGNPYEHALLTVSMLQYSFVVCVVGNHVDLLFETSVFSCLLWI